jgi:hypothetical protein
VVVAVVAVAEVVVGVVAVAVAEVVVAVVERNEITATTTIAVVPVAMKMVATMLWRLR